MRPLPLSLCKLPIALTALLMGVAAEARDNPELWLTVGADTELAPRFLLELEGVARIGDDQGGLYETEASFLLGYELTDNVSVLAGYTRVGRLESGRRRAGEDRYRQQIVARVGRIAGGNTDLRLRLEQRDRADGDDLGWRMRVRAAWTRPLLEDGPSLRVTHESFFELNDTDWGQDAGYRRARTFAGFRLPLSDALDVEIGYMNQYDIESGAEDEIAHALALQLNVGF